MNGKNTVLWITRTAIFIALLVVWQAVTAPLGLTLLTGSGVNLLLIVSVMTCGPATGLTVAALSPVLAKLVNIGPAFWTMIPFVMLGNIVLVLVWHIIGNRNIGRRYVAWVIALVAGAGLKFLVLYIGVVQVAVPVLLGLLEKQAAAVSAVFSVPQLFTAAIGGVLAILILPLVKRAIKR